MSAFVNCWTLRDRRYRYPSSPVPTVGPGSASSPACRTTGPRRQWQRSPCAPHAQRNTTIRPIDVTMRSPSGVTTAGPDSDTCAMVPRPGETDAVIAAVHRDLAGGAVCRFEEHGRVPPRGRRRRGGRGRQIARAKGTPGQAIRRHGARRRHGGQDCSVHGARPPGTALAGPTDRSVAQAHELAGLRRRSRRTARCSACCFPPRRCSTSCSGLSLESRRKYPRSSCSPAATSPASPSATTMQMRGLRLGGIADAFCDNDRAIHVPLDDSVVRVVRDVARPVRRSRGYAPRADPAALRGSTSSCRWR